MTLIQSQRWFSVDPLRSTGVVAIALILTIAWVLCPSLAKAQSITNSVKANLDLPFDAAGLGSGHEDEEGAPDILAFYGQTYEVSAVVFTLDKSGSMSGDRWSLQLREVSRSVTELDEDTEFGIVWYGSDIVPFREQPVKAVPTNKAAAMSFISSQEAYGGTCTGAGVIKALEIVNKSTSKHRAVFVTSDGPPDVCGGNGAGSTAQQWDAIVQSTVAANPGRGAKVHTLFVGEGFYGVIDFLRALADAHGGTTKIVSN